MRCSIYQNVKLFIRNKSVILNVANIFKHSLPRYYKVRPCILAYEYLGSIRFQTKF